MRYCMNTLVAWSSSWRSHNSASRCRLHSTMAFFHFSPKAVRRQSPANMQGYNFTNAVRTILAHAREQGSALKHEYVGTEHILLGMLIVPDSAAVRCLNDLGADTVKIRESVLTFVKV